MLAADNERPWMAVLSLQGCIDAEKQARQGQLLLSEAADKYGISVILTSKGAIPIAPPVLHPGNIVGSEPPEVTNMADNQCAP